ncbi:TIGR02391 family protein [Streptomyces sp. NPDC047972]|uniref:TIGR02391 family protein n=1 Tax=Streptomyces sp. NPDC047972 TaxID=3365493 RepID=UPI0037232259
MDRDWMRERLEAFETLATEYLSLKERTTTLARSLYDRGPTANDERAAELRARMFAAEPTVIKILECLDPQLTTDVHLEKAGGPATARNQVRRALGVLADMDEWATRLTPDAPSLRADQFHPWVWDAARTFWESNHFRAAVHTAATSINAHLQDMLGRTDISEAKLIQEAFSENSPAPGRPRLRVPGDPNDPGVQTRQRGAMQIGAGAYSALRNPAAHEIGELPEQEALEQLATFSVLARLISQCEVVR